MVRSADLVKIDVEGAELDVLKGMRKLMLGSGPRIIVEVWKKANIAKVRRFLSAMHYGFSKIDDHYFLCTPTSK